VGGFSKSYSSLLAFVACSTRLKEFIKIGAPPYLYSGPSPVASLATVLAGFEVNAARGDEIRADVHRKTGMVLDTLARLGVSTPNTSGFPIVEVPLKNPDDVAAVGRFLWDRGVYVTLAVYPLVPRDEVGFRIQVTAANTDEQLEHLCEVLGALAGAFELQPSPRFVDLDPPWLR
ncbi:MAG: aminotransferase class I/II-fold pyridoxal phosphate-dependent enzyme, partial [Actinomycetota bacterium]